MLKKKSYLSKRYWNKRYFVLRADNTLEYYQKCGDEKCKASFRISNCQGCEVGELYVRQHRNELVYCMRLTFSQLDDKYVRPSGTNDEDEEENSSLGDHSRDLSRGSGPMDEAEKNAALSPKSAANRVLSPFKKTFRKRDQIPTSIPETPPRQSVRSLDAESLTFGSRLRHRRSSLPRTGSNEEDGHDTFPNVVEVENSIRVRPPPMPPFSASSVRKQKIGMSGDSISAITPIIRNMTRQRSAYEEEQEEEQDFLRAQFLTTKQQNKRKTKEMVVQGAKITAAAGATVGFTFLTAGIGLVAGMVAFAVAGAAGGSGAVVNSWRRNGGCGTAEIVIASSDFETAKRWKALLDAALASDIVQKSTWGQLFASDNGRKARAALLPRSGPIHRETSFESASGGSAGVKYLGHNARWILIEGGMLSVVGCGFQGLRIYREDCDDECTEMPRYAQLSVAGKPCPLMKAHTVLSASPLDAFLCLMSHGRVDSTSNASVGTFIETERRATFEVIESIDEHTDVIRLMFRPLYLFPAWTLSRDFVLYRYWRLEPDGSYVVCFESMDHPKCPPSPDCIRGEMHSVFNIAPQKRAVRKRVVKQNWPLECLMTATVQLDPKGWVPTVRLSCLSKQAYGDAFGINALLQLIDIREAIDQDRFVAISTDNEVHSSIRSALAEDFPSFELNESPSRNGIARNQSNDTTETNDETLHEDFVNYDFAYAGNESHVTIPESATGISARPRPLTTAMWAEPDSNSFRVRGPDYKYDRQKYNAGPSIGRLIAVDVVSVDAPVYSGFSLHPTERIQLALQKERELRAKGLESDLPPFIFVVNIVLPGPPFYHGVYYYAINDRSTIDGTDGTPSSRLCNRFFFGDCDEFRDRTFKLIPQIVEGNFIVRKVVGSTPAIMGKKLRQLYVKSDRYFEVILDCGSSPVATGVIRLSLGYAKTLVVDMGFLLEGDEDEYLPERIFGCVRMKNIDFGPRMRHVVVPQDNSEHLYT
jgi:hypothetical protein